MPLPSPGGPSTRDQQRWKAQLADPLRVERPTARWLAEVLAAQPLALAEAARIKVPVLVLQGGADDSSDPETSRRFAAACSGAYEEYDGFHHEILNEPTPDRARVIARMAEWVLGRVQ